MIPEKLMREDISFVLIEKGGKRPFQTGWQNKCIGFHDNCLISHLEEGGNYGVRGGGKNKLVIVDFDNNKVQEEIIKMLPPTFTVRTGSGMLHKYFFSDSADSFKIFDEEMNTLIDVQGEGKQVVAPGSIHPNGNKYEVVDDKDIAFINYAELKAIILPYDKKPKRSLAEPKLEKPKEYSHDNFVEELKNKIRMRDVLSLFGIDTSRNPTGCPFHSSKGGKCLGFNDETAHCFHCEGSWNIYSLVMQYNKTGFKEALEILAEKAGMRDDLIASRKKYVEHLNKATQEGFSNLRLQVVDLLGDGDIEAASEVITDYIKRENYIYTTRSDVKNEIWFYKDGIYVPNGETRIKEICRNILGSFYTDSRAKYVIDKIETDTGIDSNVFFKDNHVNEIPVRNGILNVKTRELRPFNPTDIFFNKCPVTYDKTKDCPYIEKFLGDVLTKDEDKLVYYEIGGFCLYKEYTFEKAFMFVGNGRNGKGKSLELIKKVVGAENCYSLPLAALEHNNPDVSQLFGKMVNLAGDIAGGDLKDTTMFKQLTGRDLITTKRKFLTALSFENYAKFIFACNELPRVYDNSVGFWDRWVLLEYPYYFAGKEEFDKAKPEECKNWKTRDENIISKIATDDELSGLLNKFLDGLARLCINRKFSSTKGSVDIKNFWIRKSNSFHAFCMDNLEGSYGTFITKKDIRQAFAKYCNKHKIRGVSDKSIKITLEEAFGVTEGRRDILGSWDWVWEGVKWKFS